MHFFQKSLFLIFCLFLVQCSDSEKSQTQKGWANSTATIIQIEYEAAYGYMFTYEYAIPESTAINQEGKKITGPIQQHALDKKKPILNQKIPLQYLKEEPIIFKLLKPLEYEKDQASP